MAGVSQDQDDSLNVELNLVPFIDLLSSLVLFLLITAVWMQIGTVPVDVESKGRGQAPPSPSQTLFVHVKNKVYELNWSGAKLARPLPKAIPRSGDSIPDREALQNAIGASFAEGQLPSMAAV